MSDITYTRARKDLGMADDEGVFTDVEMADFVTRAGEDYGSATSLAQFKYIKLMMLDTLLFDTAKLNSYARSTSSNNVGETFDRLFRMRELLSAELDKLGVLDDLVDQSKVMWGSPRNVPMRDKEWPDDFSA